MGGNKKELGVLKAMITEEVSVIEGKGKDRIMVRNFKHVIISSNEPWPVHLDRDDRRFLVLQVSDKYKEGQAYFAALKRQLDNGGLEALLYDLLHEDLSGFDPRALPQNTAAFSVKLHSAQSTEKYIYEALRTECFDVGNATPSAEWPTAISTESVYSDYRAWCDKQDIRLETKEQLGTSIKRLIPSAEKRKPRNDSGRRCQQYEFPELTRAREEFQKAFKAGPAIWEE